ncbi:LacI family DNA-binding transcriptional regulator [Parvularcula sp. LCG005]|uniref:LacI family DNA-binding transcriptional regulator n=1 Tax=Parvularcula sp. LCG005 TaxID=3078805 RepID=UPI002942CC77|nr:LacI family DNA-binding transcriptional regulator [Parvularcula sp. LCG005]WOI53464.1 LacI family DNA-binding transcriptional regulator [Parvularcula sp. LCG005]
MAQIRDVARMAGVSPATVSRAYTQPDKVSPDTLARVREAAENLNYKPNSMAKAFRGKSTDSVLILVPELSNVLFTRVLSGIERVATENNYYLLVSDTHDDVEIERSGVELVETNRADGVIQLGGRPLEVLHKRGDDCGIPFVHAIEPVGHRPYPTVSVDNEAAAESMASYLLALGHRRIGVLAGIPDRDVTRTRLNGFRRALAAYDLEYSPNDAEFNAFSLSGGAEAALRLLTRTPDLTALFCMSDEIAIGAMRTCLDRGMRVPDDISITGFDNIAFSRFSAPPLTTVMQPAERMGEIAMTLMVNRLKGRPGQERQILPTELVIRGSCRRI